EAAARSGAEAAIASASARISRFMARARSAYTPSARSRWAPNSGWNAVAETRAMSVRAMTREATSGTSAVIRMAYTTRRAVVPRMRGRALIDPLLARPEPPPRPRRLARAQVDAQLGLLQRQDERPLAPLRP